MLIARAKRKENIIEYLLYMYQIEDIIRSLGLDIEAINKAVIANFDQPMEVKAQIREWYAALILEMKENKLERNGHLPALKQLVAELQELHTILLTTIQDKTYQKLYNEAREELIMLVKRSGGAQLDNEIDVALNGMYGLLILKLKKEEISKDTQEAMQKISRMLGHLALQFKRKEEGDLSVAQFSNN